MTCPTHLSSTRWFHHHPHSLTEHCWLLHRVCQFSPQQRRCVGAASPPGRGRGAHRYSPGPPIAVQVDDHGVIIAKRFLVPLLVLAPRLSTSAVRHRVPGGQSAVTLGGCRTLVQSPSCAHPGCWGCPAHQMPTITPGSVMRYRLMVLFSSSSG